MDLYQQAQFPSAGQILYICIRFDSLPPEDVMLLVKVLRVVEERKDSTGILLPSRAEVEPIGTHAAVWFPTDRLLTLHLQG